MLNFLKKNKTKSFKAIGGNDIVYTPIYHNDAVSIVHDACVICVDGKKERTLEQKFDFIAGKVKLGHESILEHSNYIVKLEFESDDNYYINALYEIMDCLKFLNVKTKVYTRDNNTITLKGNRKSIIKNNTVGDNCVICGGDLIINNTSESKSKYTILIGGSARGYKHVVRTVANYKNPVYLALLDYIKLEMPSCFFSDLIEEGIFRKLDFMDVISKENGYHNKDYRSCINKDLQSVGKVLAVDPIKDIYNKLNGEFSYYELMDFCMVNTVSVNVSRSCSHQEVRHRAAITQLSQRYVDMGDSIELNSLIEDEDIDLSEFFNTDTPLSLSTHEYMKFSKFVYNKLIEKGWKKEDARFLLPNLTATTLYMSYTFRGLFKAIELREGKGAQKEIKQVFKCLESEFKTNLDVTELEGYTIHDYILPRYDFESLESSRAK